nr:Chain P, FMDV PEPTIDE [synthetic construct]
YTTSTRGDLAHVTTT